MNTRFSITNKSYNTTTKRIKGNTAIGLLFLMPSLIGLIVFILIPMISSFLLSFTEWSVIKGLSGVKFVGLENFLNLFEDVKFKIAMSNTLKYSLMTVPTSLVIGFIIAVLIHDYCFAKNAMKVAIFMPYISSLVAITVVWQVLLNPTRGPVNMLLRSIGVSNPPGWFASTQWAIVGVALETIWLTIGYNMVIYSAGFTAINTDLYDAASIDGCGGFRRTIYVTIPGVSSTTFFLVIMAIINSFKVFDQISVIQSGTPSDATLVIAYNIYLQAFSYYKMGYASAMSWIMFLILMVITVVQWKFGERDT